MRKNVFLPNGNNKSTFQPEGAAPATSSLKSSYIKDEEKLSKERGTLKTPPPHSGLLRKKYYFCTVEQSRMNYDRTYRPAPYAPAPRLRDADGSLCQAPSRSAGHAATHPVQPLKGLPGTRATDVSYRASVPAGHAGRGVALSYRALVPGGAGFCYRICTGTSESRLTAHY